MPTSTFFLIYLQTDLCLRIIVQGKPNLYLLFDGRKNQNDVYVLILVKQNSGLSITLSCGHQIYICVFAICAN